MTALSERVAELREPIARIIDPSRWRALDSYLADTKRKYAGQHAGYDPASFKDLTSLAKADLIFGLIGDALLADHARLVEQLAQADKHLAETVKALKECVRLMWADNPADGWADAIAAARSAIDAIPAEIMGRIGG